MASTVMTARSLVAHLTNEDTADDAGALDALELLLVDPSAANIVYEKIIARVLTDVSQSPNTLSLAVGLIGRLLPDYAPDVDTARKLGVFCRSLLGSPTVSGAEREAVKAVADSVTALLESIDGDGGPARLPSSLETGKSLLSSLVYADTEELTPNLVHARPRPKVFPKSSPPPGVLLRCGLFGSHVPVEGTAADPVVEPENALWCDVSTESVGVVNKMKKEEEYVLRKIKPATLYRRGQLFHYKHYTEQLPLSITQEEMAEVMEGILHPPDLETRLMGSKVLIKVIIDIMCTDDRNATAAVLSVFMELLSQHSWKTRAHAFALLFNLSVHINLLADCYSIHIEGDGATPDHLKMNKELVDTAQEDLFAKLCEMLLFLFHNDEKEQGVIHAALSTMLYFATKEGSVLKARLYQLDARTVVWFLTALKAPSVEVERMLVRMLCNLVYPTSELDIPALLVVSNHLPNPKLRPHHLFFVCDLYRRVRSAEARSNLFAIIFDAIVLTVKQHGAVKVRDEQAAVVFELLRRSGAHLILTQIFTFLPDKFVETFVRYLFFEQLRKDPSLRDVARSLDKTLIVSLLYDLEKLASSFQKYHASFNSTFQRMVASQDLAPAQVSLLDGLIGSPFPDDVRNGEALLFAVLRSGLEGRATPAVTDKVNRFVNSLLASDSPSVRRVFLSITEKMVLYHKAKNPAHGNAEEARAMLDFLSERLSCLMTAQETDQDNLLYAFDVVFNLITVPTIPMDGVGASGLEGQADDSNAAQFLRNELCVPHRLLDGISVAPLQYLFTHIREARLSCVRTVLLILIVRKCSDKAVLDCIGGMTFFKGLLDDRNSHVAFLASRYLVAQLMAEKPEQYNALLQKIRQRTLVKHPELDDTTLDNSYHQIKAILDLKKRQAKKAARNTAGR